MKLLLTSGGVTNPSIHAALVNLLGKPASEADALCIPTAAYAHPWAGPRAAWNFISGRNTVNAMCSLGWKSLGVLELTTLPSLDPALWHKWVQQADVLLADGGDSLYLCHWMRESGLAELLPSLKAVYVGMSAGSMVMTPRIGRDFVGWEPAAGDDRAIGMVDFSIFPHLAHPQMPDNTLQNAEKWAVEIAGPAYAIDDQTAIVVAGGKVEVVSEGQWMRFGPGG